MESKETKHFVPVVRDNLAQEAILNVEEMRLQLQTQLDPYSVENLFFSGNQADEYDTLALKINLRQLSQYNLEKLKERLRGYTETTLSNFHSHIQEYKPFVTTNPMLPQLVPTMPNQDSKLSRTTSEQEIEISSLEQDLKRELHQISKLKSKIQIKLANKSLPNLGKAATNKENEKRLNELESWADNESISYFTLQTSASEPAQITVPKFIENNINIFVKETATQVAQAKALTMQIISQIDNEL